MDTSTDQPLQNINVCWERSTDSTSGEMILDQGCIRTDAGGYYKVPGIYKLFQGSVANFRIYYNMKILPPTKKPEVQSYISTKNYIEPFNLAGTNENPISEIEGYSTEKFTVYFSKSIPMYIPQKVNIGLYQKE